MRRCSIARRGDLLWCCRGCESERERNQVVLDCEHLYRNTPLKRTCHVGRELEAAWLTPCLLVPDAEPSHRVCRSQRYRSDSGPPKLYYFCCRWTTCRAAKAATPRYRRLTCTGTMLDIQHRRRRTTYFDVTSERRWLLFDL